MSASSGVVDVLVAGAGITGLTLATAIAQAMAGCISVEVWDPGLSRRSPPQRVSAIAEGSLRMLERLGVWSRLPAAQPIAAMEITDSRLGDVVRPRYLRFDSAASPGGALAHMCSNSDLESALESAALAAGVVLRSEAAERYNPDAAGVCVVAKSGRLCRARLLAAADGARSPLREAARISSVSWTYPAKAMVFTVEHEREHGGLARQHFLPAGPFATLPLPGKRSSIVWTEPTRTANRLMALSAERFHAELEARFGLELGGVSAVDRPLSFDLSFSLARTLCAQRLALVGDAAHRVHPLAGQGLNVGFRDAATLAEFVVDALRLGLDPASDDCLGYYERARRFDAFTVGVATDALDRLFRAEGPLRLVRDLGMSLTNRSTFLKGVLTLEAAGLTGSPPRLMRGLQL